MQADEGVRRIVGIDQIPDPTTAGDFLRRLDPESQEKLNQAIDEAHEQVWRQRNGRRKAPWAVVDLDSHVHPVYGSKKSGSGRALFRVCSGRRRSAFWWLARVVPLGVLTGVSEALDRSGFGTDRSSTGDARCSSSSRVSTSMCREKVCTHESSTHPVAEPRTTCSGERGATGGTQREDPCLARRHAYPVSSSRPAYPVASTWHGRTRVREGPASSPLARPPTAPKLRPSRITR